ncbi:YheV family putative zinc ribbon protein [Aliikangiella sp. IMCC44653]
MQPNQRFIAGATCPKCGDMDSLLLNTEDQSIECVECHFTQSQQERDAQQQKQTQPINKTKPKKVEVSDIIRITNIDK